MSNYLASIACRFIATNPDGEPKFDICIAGPQEMAEDYCHWIRDRIAAGDLPAPEPGEPLTIKLPAPDLRPLVELIPERWPDLKWAQFEQAFPLSHPRSIPAMPKITRMAHPVMFLEIAGVDTIVIGGPKKDAERCLKAHVARHAEAYGLFPDRKPDQLAHVSCNGIGAAAEICRALADGFPTVGWMTMREYQALKEPKPKRNARKSRR